MFLYLFRSQANWDEHCMNVSSALHHVLKAWQCDSKAVPPEQLQVTPVHLTKYNGFEIYRYSQNLICTQMVFLQELHNFSRHSIKNFSSPECSGMLFNNTVVLYLE